MIKSSPVSRLPSEELYSGLEKLSVRVAMLLQRFACIVSDASSNMLAAHSNPGSAEIMNSYEAPGAVVSRKRRNESSGASSALFGSSMLRE